MSFKKSYYFLLFIIFVLFGLYSTFQFSHADFIYASSAILNGKLYNSLNFLQAPLAFYILKVFKFFTPDSLSLYLVIRLQALFFTIFPYLIISLLFKDIKLKILLALAFTSNIFIQSVPIMAGSYGLALSCLTFSIYLLIKVYNYFLLKEDLLIKSPNLYLFLSGAFITIATSAKINFMIYLCPYLITILYLKLKSKKKILTFSLLGLLVGSTPIIFYLINENFGFILNNISFHSDYVAARRGLTNIAKIKSLYNGSIKWIQYGGSLSIASIFLWFIGRIKLKEKIFDNISFILFNFLIFSFVAALIPMTFKPQYWYQASFFSISLAAYFSQYVVSKNYSYFFLGIFSLLIVFQIQSFLPNLVRSFERGNGIFQVLEINKEIKNDLKIFNKKKCNEEIFTYSGALTMDTGFPLAKGTEAGGFWISTKEFFSEDDIRLLALKNKLQIIEVPSLKDSNIVVLGYYLNYKWWWDFEEELYENAINSDFVELGKHNFRGKEIKVLARSSCINK